MANYRYAAIVLGLVAGIVISWHLGLGSFVFAPQSAAGNAAEVATSAPNSTSTPTQTPIVAPKGVISSQQFEGIGYLLYVPTSAAPDHPVTALVTVRGMGDKAEDFASSFAPLAEANGWMLIVPHFNYGDWKQTETLRTEDRANSAWLRALLDALPGQVTFPIRSKILIYGFSRGAQVAHRFALMHPSRVLAVASMSAGTYTLPAAKAAPTSNTPLDFPLGVADLAQYCGSPFDPTKVKQVAFWIGVGDKDTSPGDVPQNWDQYIGSTRVERAKTFAKAMSDLGAPVQLEIIPGLGHGENAESRAKAMAFLKAEEQKAIAAEAAPSPTPVP